MKDADLLEALSNKGFDGNDIKDILDVLVVLTPAEHASQGNCDLVSRPHPADHCGKAWRPFCECGHDFFNHATEYNTACLIGDCDCEAYRVAPPTQEQAAGRAGLSAEQLRSEWAGALYENNPTDVWMRFAVRVNAMLRSKAPVQPATVKPEVNCRWCAEGFVRLLSASETHFYHEVPSGSRLCLAASAEPTREVPVATSEWTDRHCVLHTHPLSEDKKFHQDSAGKYLGPCALHPKYKVAKAGEFAFNREHKLFSDNERVDGIDPNNLSKKFMYREPMDAEEAETTMTGNVGAWYSSAVYWKYRALIAGQAAQPEVREALAERIIASLQENSNYIELPDADAIEETKELIVDALATTSSATPAPPAFRCSICEDVTPHSHSAIDNRTNDPSGNNQGQKIVGWSEPKYFVTPQQPVQPASGEKVGGEG